MSDYVCPNGHPFPDRIAVECGEASCSALVACVPASELFKHNITISPEIADVLFKMTQRRGTVYIVRASDDTIEVLVRMEDPTHPDGVTTYSMVIEEDGNCISALDLDPKREDES